MKHRVLFGVLIILVVAAGLYAYHKPTIKGELPAKFEDEETPRNDAKERVMKKSTKQINPKHLEFIENNLVSGGVPKDAIPSVDNPRYVSADVAEAKDYVSGDELIFGYVSDGQAYAYPQSIMYWHEIVNEEFGGEKVSITYCPLTGSIIGFKGKELGVSGSLYNSNLVMYDRETGARIPQILGVGIEDELEGERLDRVHVTVAKWKDWKAKYPDTNVLSRETGVDRDYDRSPYPGYDDALRVWFPLAAKSDLFHSKKIMYGIEHDGKFLAVPKKEFAKTGKDTVMLGGDEVTLEYDDRLKSIRAFVGDEEVSSMRVYWFAWYAYHPSTDVWQAE